MKILSFGSLNIDYVYTVPHFVKKGETLSAKELNVYTGGKGLNQAIALSRAGLNTYMAGAVGTDGQFLLDNLKEAGEQEMPSFKMIQMEIIAFSYTVEQISQLLKSRLMKYLQIFPKKIMYYCKMRSIILHIS